MTSAEQQAISTRSDSEAPDGSIKETFVSLIISFVMALVFRSYIVEAFVIPTGSMAPTLLGAHIEFTSDQTGYQWNVNPWYENSSRTRPLPLQGQTYGRLPPADGAPSATDPMTTSKLNSLGGRTNPHKNIGYVIQPEIKKLRAGDRILVQKYLYNLFPPKRWDVVVFKNPELASQNFIKRLIGLPGEEIWIVDGDIFVREDASEQWHIARKPPSTQRGLWRRVFSSEYAPIRPELDGQTWFKSPWSGANWLTGARQSYRCETPDQSRLEWNSTTWPIWDWVPYNEWPGKLRYWNQIGRFPVGDVRLKAGIEPDESGLEVIAMVGTREHEFRALFGPDRVGLEMRRRAPGSGIGIDWIELTATDWSGFDAGTVTSVEFWHVDQALALVVDGRRLLETTYEWSPSDRLRYATGQDADVYRKGDRGTPSLGADDTYKRVKPSLSWTFRGSALTMHRVGLDRDLYYEPIQNSRDGTALATHPSKPAKLGPEHFFVLGDNSPSSKDGRLWTSVDDAVRLQIDDAIGVVHRKLMLGKAFFVYFPAPHLLGGRIPIPDFGHMRFIR